MGQYINRKVLTHVFNEVLEIRYRSLDPAGVNCNAAASTILNGTMLLRPRGCVTFPTPISLPSHRFTPSTLWQNVERPALQSHRLKWLTFRAILISASRVLRVKDPDCKLTSSHEQLQPADAGRPYVLVGFMITQCERIPQTTFPRSIRTIGMMSRLQNCRHCV